MKHLNSLIIVVLSIFTLTPGLSAEEISHTYHFGTPTVKHMDGYSEICIPGTRNVGTPGDPLLPAKGVYLLLPPGQCVGEVEVIPGERITFPGSFDIRPAEREYPLSYQGPFVPTPPNTEIYNSDKPYPGKLLRSYTTQSLCGYNIAVLALCPVEYIPAKGELAYYSSLEVRITTATSEKSRNATANFLRTTPQVQARVRRIVDNVEDISRYGFGEGMGDEEIDYVIITSDGLSSSFETLREFKNRRGIRTVIKTIEEIYTEYSGIDDQDKIRNFIIDACQNWGTEYVLLGGDDNIIPHRGLYATAYGYVDDDIPADIYYGALDGNWNNDGDSRWGEPGEDDLLTEVFVGRAAVETSAEADNFVNKVIMYQESPVVNECTEALMVGELLWYDPTWGGDYKDEIKDGSDACGYTTVGFPEWWNVQTLYDRDLGYSWSAMNDLLPILNGGVSIVNHLGHSWIDYVMRFDDHQVTDGNFTNNGTDHSFYIIYTQGCYPNAFDHEAISERFTGIQNGAVAFVGNTRYGWGMHNSTCGSSQYFDRQFFDALFGEGIYRIGEMNDDSKVDNIWIIDVGAIRWCYYQLCLIGDPQMPIWTEVPEILTVNHSPVCLIGSDQFDVFVPGVEGALVGLYKDGELLGRAYTNAVGAATVFFDVIPLSPGEMDVTVTAHNYLPYQGVVEVIPPEGPYVIYDSFAIDDSTGNNNGVVNPGETIAVSLTLKNVGVETAFNVSATLSSADSFVTISDSVKFFGNIDSSGIATSVGDYIFEVALDCPGQHFIAFDLTITADGSYEWSSLFTVEVWTQDIAVSEDTLDYGIVYLGFSLTDTLIVSNVGNESLTVSDISSDNSDYTVDITSFILNPWESQEVLVTFTPSTAGQILGTLTIESDDPDEPIVTIFLQGESGEEPDILVTPDSLREDLGTDSISTQVLMIYNTANPGASDLIFNISIEFGSLPNWLTVDPISNTIPAGSSSDISVTFDATGIYGGDYLADIIIASNDPDEDTVTVAAYLHVTGGEEGLVGCWSFDEGSGNTAHDYSGHGNHGTIDGAEWVDGISGSALEIVDTDIVRFIPSSFDDSITTSLTIASWVKFYGESSHGSYNLLFDARDGYGRQAGFNFRLNASGTVRLLFADGSDWHNFSSADKAPLNEWTHIAGVYDYVSQTVSIFINGVKDTIAEAPFPYAQTTLSAAIGNNRWAPGDHKWRPFNGIIDELRIYNRALTEAEIESLYCDVPRGDANSDGKIDLGDVVYLINYLFKGGPPPCPLVVGDVNCDGVVDIGDVVYLINYLFGGGPPPREDQATASARSGLELCKGKAPAQIGLSSVTISKDDIFNLPVIGKFGVDVAAIQLEIEYDPEKITLLEPALTPKTEGLTIYSSANQGTQKIGILDLSGERYVSTGAGALVTLRMKGSDLSSLKITEAVLMDRDARKIPVQIVSVIKNSEEDFTAGKSAIPQEFSLSQNYPNPFNPETEISYALPNACHVELLVYNLLGQKVRTLLDEYQAAGHKTIHWDGTDENGNQVASGIYFYKIQAGEFTNARKMILMK